MKTAWKLLKTTFSEFSDDNATTLGAALAFYTALSLAPLLLILIWILGLLGEGSQQQVVDQVTGFVGQEGGKAIEMIAQNASKNRSGGTISAIIGFAMLAFSATGVFAQLQMSLNRIWDVEADPNEGMWGVVRKRLLSFGTVLVIAFLLLVSLVVSAALRMVFPTGGLVWTLVNLFVSLAVFVFLFAFMFKFLPDVDIAWKDVWIGAGITAVLFAAGKFAIGTYLGYSSVGSSYGAAGSLIVLLVWVFYASLVFFFGAEFTQVYASWRGSRIVPDKHAQRIGEPVGAGGTGPREHRPS